MLTITDEEDKKKLEELKKIRHSVGMFSSDELNELKNNNATASSFTDMNRLNELKKIRHSVGMFSSDELEEINNKKENNFTSQADEERIANKMEEVWQKDGERNVANINDTNVTNLESNKIEETQTSNINNTQNVLVNNSKNYVSRIKFRDKTKENQKSDTNNISSSEQNEISDTSSTKQDSSQNISAAQLYANDVPIISKDDPRFVLQRKVLGTPYNRGNLTAEDYKQLTEMNNVASTKTAEKINEDVKNGNFIDYIGHLLYNAEMSLSGGMMQSFMNLLNVGTTLTGLGARATGFIGKITNNEDLVNKSDEVYDRVVAEGSYINNMANFMSNINAQIEDDVIRTTGSVSNQAGRMLMDFGTAQSLGTTGATIQGIGVAGSSSQEVLDEGGNILQAAATGGVKGYISKKIEDMFDANLLTRGGSKSSISKQITYAIHNFFKSDVGRNIAELTVGVVGENIEEVVEDNFGYVWDALINNKELPSFEEWWNNTTETVKITTLTTLLMDILGFGGTHNEKWNELKTDVDFWNYQAQKIIDKGGYKIQYDVNKVIDKTKVGLFLVGNYDNNGELQGVTSSIGKAIDNPNKNVNVNPVIVKNNNAETYNIIDGNTGVVVDGSPYTSLIQAQAEFNSKMNNLDNATINNINQKVIEANITIKKKTVDILSQVQNNETNNISQTHQNEVTDDLNNETENYTNQSVGNVTNENSNNTQVQKNTNNNDEIQKAFAPLSNKARESVIENITNIPQTSQNQSTGNLNNETITNFNQNIKSNAGENSNNTTINNSHERTFIQEIDNYKNVSTQQNITNGNVTQINNNILDGISKRKQSQFMNEYLKNEVNKKDYYVGKEKIIANKYTIGKLKNGKTNFDKRIPQSMRYELKANIIGNLDNIIKTSTIKKADIPDTKGHDFANTFDRRVSIFNYQGQNYEVMFEVGKKKGFNTLYSIENIKKTQKNRFSFPNLDSERVSRNTKNRVRTY